MEKLERSLKRFKESYNEVKKEYDDFLKKTSQLRQTAKNIPTNRHDLVSLLDELAESDEDCSDHFNRFKEESKLEYDNQSLECRDNWSRCYNRKCKALNQLIRFARFIKFGPKP